MERLTADALQILTLNWDAQNGGNGLFLTVTLKTRSLQTTHLSRPSLFMKKLYQLMP